MPAEAAIDLDGGKAYRATLKSGARAHVDRPLPFLILHRFSGRDPDSLALRVASTSPSYLVWPDAGDGEAAGAGRGDRRHLSETSERVLLVSLYDLPRDPTLDDTAPRLERFTCRLGASDDPAAQAAANRLEKALAAIEVDLRTCTIERVSGRWCEPGVEALIGRAPGLSHISLGLPQNYRIPGEDGIYPQLLHELGIGVFDALLQAFCAFIDETSARAPVVASRARPQLVHRRRAHGGSQAVQDRDLLRFPAQRLADQQRRGLRPVQGVALRQAPVFRYRPLTVDPERTKRDLYAIDLRRVEDPVLETLFSEKRRELGQQLTMLECRNTPDFRYASLMLYGSVERPLLESARDILAKVEKSEAADPDMVDAPAVRDAARLLVDRYRAANPAFEARISLRADIAAGLMVSGHRLLIATDTQMRRHRLEALLQHEVSVHLLTCVNGAAQGLRIFEAGLAGYEGVQEGLGVFAECAVGGLTAARLRLLAARVIVVDAMIEGADFIHCFRLLRDEHGFGARTAFNIVARVFSAGGLAKDAIYLRGFKEVLDHLAAGRDLAPFWFGKIAARHIPVVEELELRGLLRRPRSLPEFLASPEAQARIAAMATLASLSQLIVQET